MVARSTIPRIGERSRHRHPQILNRQDFAINHAVRLIHAVCGLAGSAQWIDDIRADLRADKVQTAIRHRDTAVVFDWLMAALSYQGIADAVAYHYMERHGRAAWRVRDLADGDLIGWIDGQLQAANSPPGPNRLTRMAAALIEPLREIYGVSDKVLAMALSSLLLGAPKKMVLWTEVGGSMIAIDTLGQVPHWTGILQRFKAKQQYGLLDHSDFSPVFSSSTRSGSTAPGMVSMSGNGNPD